MKNSKQILTILPVLLISLLVVFSSCETGGKQKKTTQAKKEQSKTYKMTTQVPDNVLIPDKVETRLGTLEFFDGVPTAETAQKVWDHQDFSRAVESMIMCTPAASLAGFRRGIREFGPDNETAIIWESRLDSKALLNTFTVGIIPGGIYFN